MEVGDDRRRQDINIQDEKMALGGRPSRSGIATNLHVRSYESSPLLEFDDVTMTEDDQVVNEGFSGTVQLLTNMKSTSQSICNISGDDNISI